MNYVSYKFDLFFMNLIYFYQNCLILQQNWIYNFSALTVKQCKFSMLYVITTISLVRNIIKRSKYSI